MQKAQLKKINNILNNMLYSAEYSQPAIPLPQPVLKAYVTFVTQYLTTEKGTEIAMKDLQTQFDYTTKILWPAMDKVKKDLSPFKLTVEHMAEKYNKELPNILKATELLIKTMPDKQSRTQKIINAFNRLKESLTKSFMEIDGSKILMFGILLFGILMAYSGSESYSRAYENISNSLSSMIADIKASFESGTLTGAFSIITAPFKAAYKLMKANLKDAEVMIALTSIILMVVGVGKMFYDYKNMDTATKSNLNFRKQLLSIKYKVDSLLESQEYGPNVNDVRKHLSTLVETIEKTYNKISVKNGLGITINTVDDIKKQLNKIVEIQSNTANVGNRYTWDAEYVLRKAEEKLRRIAASEYIRTGNVNDEVGKQNVLVRYVLAALRICEKIRNVMNPLYIMLLGFFLMIISLLAYGVDKILSFAGQFIESAYRKIVNTKLTDSIDVFIQSIKDVFGIVVNEVKSNKLALMSLAGGYMMFHMGALVSIGALTIDAIKPN